MSLATAGVNKETELAAVYFKDMETTARLAPGGSAPVSAALCAASWVMTQSIPARIYDAHPIIELVTHSSTCTGMTVAFFATPYRLPAAVEATCVPCWPPAEFMHMLPFTYPSVVNIHMAAYSSMLRAPHPASVRPPKSVWSVIMPVSRT